VPQLIPPSSISETLEEVGKKPQKAEHSQRDSDDHED
jgi:hypothetical protein